MNRHGHKFGLISAKLCLLQSRTKHGSKTVKYNLYARVYIWFIIPTEWVGWIVNIIKWIWITSVLKWGCCLKLHTSRSLYFILIWTKMVCWKFVWLEWPNCTVIIYIFNSTFIATLKIKLSTHRKQDSKKDVSDWIANWSPSRQDIYRQIFTKLCAEDLSWASFSHSLFYATTKIVS